MDFKEKVSIFVEKHKGITILSLYFFIGFIQYLYAVLTYESPYKPWVTGLPAILIWPMLTLLDLWHEGRTAPVSWFTVGLLAVIFILLIKSRRK